MGRTVGVREGHRLIETSDHPDGKQKKGCQCPLDCLDRISRGPSTATVTSCPFHDVIDLVGTALCRAMDFICDPWGYHGWEVHLLH
jgi:hypothetical protein